MRCTHFPPQLTHIFVTPSLAHVNLICNRSKTTERLMWSGSALAQQNQVELFFFNIYPLTKYLTQLTQDSLVLHSCTHMATVSVKGLKKMIAPTRPNTHISTFSTDLLCSSSPNCDSARDMDSVSRTLATWRLSAERVASSTPLGFP